MIPIFFKPIKLIIFTGIITLINSPAIASVCKEKIPTFKPPHRSTTIGNRSDAATRTFCPQEKQVFTALVPPNSFGLTVSEFPIFWLYVPYTSGIIELIIQDRNTKNRLYTTKYKLENNRGLIGLRSGKDRFILESGREYIWSFDLLCNPEISSDRLSISGIIIRQPINSQLKRKIELSSPSERLNIYANYGIWFEMLSELIKLGSENPSDPCFKSIWDKLLNENLIDPNLIQ